VRPPKHHLQNRYKMWFMKHDIIPTDPNGPAKSRHPDQN
jgi:hypothetical protein